MSRANVSDKAASVRQRLLNLARQRGENFNLVLTHYALERFLYRLSISPHADNLVLKGAMRFMAWTREVHRPTRDLDLTGLGRELEQDLGMVMFEILEAGKDLNDGLRFDGGINLEAIREDQLYQGIRVGLTAFLGAARIPLQIDVGFADAVKPETIDYPVLLDSPAPRIKAYPKESVVAEKLQALVALGMANSRMKDFYDLWTMSRIFDFNGISLAEAIAATFQRRKTGLPENIPIGLSDDFSLDKEIQWKAFISRNSLETGGANLPAVIADLRKFLLQPTQAAAVRNRFQLSWQAGKEWS